MPDLSAWLKQVKARLSRATPGPWEVRRGDSTTENLVADVRGLTIYGPYKSVSCGDDAALITHAPDDLAHAVAVIEAAQAVIQEARVARDALAALCRRINECDLEEAIITDEMLSNYQGFGKKLDDALARYHAVVGQKEEQE